MKVGISIALLFVFTIQTFSSFVIDAAYYCNQTYVAAKLCVNQTKPQLHCNGKCYLSKQILKENKSQSQSGTSKKENASQPSFFISKNDLTLAALFSQSLVHTAFYHISQQDYSFSLLKPPCSFFV